MATALLQMCTDGAACKRRVCFFAHSDNELRKPEEDPMWMQQQLQSELAAGAWLATVALRPYTWRAC